MDTKACTNGVQTTSSPLIIDQSITRITPTSAANNNVPFSMLSFSLTFAIFSLFRNAL
jgi:hypothetical protein